MRPDSQVTLTEGDEAGDVQNAIQHQVMHLELIEVHQPPKELMNQG